MRPLIVDLSCNYGGAEVRVLELARGFTESGVSSAIAALAGSPLARRAQRDGLAVHELRGARGNPQLALRLATIVRDCGYDVLDCHNSQSQLWGELAGLVAGDTRRCITVHSVCRDEKPGVRGRLYELLLAGTAASADVIVAVCDSVQEYLLHRGVPASKVRTIPNAIRFADSGPRRSSSLREELGWTGKLVLSCVARLEPVKGLNYLVDAIARIAEQQPDLRCLIAGEGPMRNQLEAQIQQLRLVNRVHLAGFREDVRSLLADSALFCLPSLTEGLPFALLEACERRVPIIASNVGGMARLLCDGETALMVEPSDAQSLADAINWMIVHPDDARAMARRAYQLVQERFRPEVMVEQTLAAYSRSVRPA